MAASRLARAGRRASARQARGARLRRTGRAQTDAGKDGEHAPHRERDDVWVAAGEAAVAADAAGHKAEVAGRRAARAGCSQAAAIAFATAREAFDAARCAAADGATEAEAQRAEFAAHKAEFAAVEAEILVSRMPEVEEQLEWQREDRSTALHVGIVNADVQHGFEPPSDMDVASKP